MIESARLCPGQPPYRTLLAGWTHNPSVVGSSPTRPTPQKSLATCAGVSGLARVRSSSEGIPHPVRRIAAEQPQVAPEQAGHADCRV